MLHENYYADFLATNRYCRELMSYDYTSLHSPSIYLKKNEKRLINFSSNDYLGLSTHPQLKSKAAEYADKWGLSSSSSRSVAGNFFLYEKLETKLANAIGKPAALILGSGFQTNLTVLEALLDPLILKQEPLVFCDRFCHISLLTPARYFTRVHRFHHNNFDHLETLVNRHYSSGRPLFIIAESIYSMDGDQTNFAEIIRIAKKYHAFLYVDDAHAVGIEGPTGWGSATAYSQEIDLIMGTFSKALGSFGAYIACSLTLRDYLINKCKGLIYATGLPPPVLGAIAAAIDLIPDLLDQRQKLKNYSNQLRTFFTEHGLNAGTSTTHIIPWIIGDSAKTLRASALLEELGILGAAIRPPTVTPGQSRIRFCLSAGHSQEDLDYLIEAIQKVERKL